MYLFLNLCALLALTCGIEIPTRAPPNPTCNDVKCRAREICQIVNGIPACVPLSKVNCHAVGDPHYKTFDDRFYDFQGTCTYTIAKTCGRDTSLINFNIEAKNENRGNTQVSYVSNVTVNITYQNSQSIVINVLSNDFGFVKVHNNRHSLPLILNNAISIFQSGYFVNIVTDFGLEVLYDWNSMLYVFISSSYFQNVCGMCGNYNEDPSDDFATPSGIQANNPTDFGKSWRVNDGNNNCWDDCNGECKPCPPGFEKNFLDSKKCGLITAENGPFKQCTAKIDPKIYVDNCVYDVCLNGGSKYLLCQSLATYAFICQINDIPIGEWRSLVGCPLQCPPNSHYNLCGPPCNPTCNDAAIKQSSCSGPCLETCQCNDGFVLDGGKCIGKVMCGCIFEGKYYAPNETFWGDDNCEKLCICNPNTKRVECKMTKCKPTETCTVIDGIRGCYPKFYGTCTVSTDPHYYTFDGVGYDFQGTCVYLLAGLCTKNTGDLVNFQVHIRNENRAVKSVSYPAEVRVFIYDLYVVITRHHPGQILVNGILISLPYIVDRGMDQVSIYLESSNGVLKTRFGIKVLYNWNSWVAVTVPGSYGGQLCGLCGNFNGDIANEFVMKNGQIAANPVVFAQSWKVQSVLFCSDDDKANCLQKSDLEQIHRRSRSGCGILLDTSGPFRDCHAVVKPEVSFKDCVFDACFYKDRQDIICLAILSYVLACQKAGGRVYPWRSDTFCSPDCPINSHYEVCTSGCAPTCPYFFPPLGCNRQCSEGCQCDDGFILSGADCVPISMCGCMYNGVYYRMGQVFYPNGLCNQKCVCTEGGVVVCKDVTCGTNEKCKVVNGVQKCQPVDSAQCSAAGDPHYISFDGRAFDFQGNCTYTLSKTVTDEDNLVPFAINVKNEKWGNGKVTVTKLVSLDAYGYILILQYNVQGLVMINEAYYIIPVNLEAGKIRVYLHGARVIIDTDFGVKISYDLVYHVIVTVPGNYKDQLGGLCGNYNGDQNDDFQLPSKTVTTDATVFGASWQVPIPGEICDNGCGGRDNPCPPCDDKKIAIFKMDNYCGFIKKVGGPLSACYDIINPDIYVNNCIFDMCSGAGDGDTLCQNIQSYADVCQAVGINIEPWRTDIFCPFTCPADSTYKLCADVCSSMCASITDIAECPTTCSEGCECNDGFFFDGNNCVTIDNCGCYKNGQYYQPNVIVLSSDCKESCICIPTSGLLCVNTDCAPDEVCMIQDGVANCINRDPCKSVICRVKETCQVQNGRPVCVPNFTGTCWAWGDPHYHTFDGYNFDFQGTCTYVLSKYDGNDSGLVPFTIEEKNDNRGSQAVSYVRTVTIYMYGFKITIMKEEFGKVRVNDMITNLPFTLLNGRISISISGINAVVHTDFGLLVTYDYQWQVVVELSSSYYGLTRGLCGNFNQNINDELITSDNRIAIDILDWAKSWKVDDRDPFCFDECPGLNCPTCDDDEKKLYGGDNQCGLISKVENGPFRECHSVINPDNFFDSCLYDVCMNGGANQILCQALRAYAVVCGYQGVKIYDWRTPSGCMAPCPANSHYEFCGSACPATCADPTAPSRCPYDCVASCFCNDGFVLSVDKCVPTSSCGCSYNGAYYQPNEEFWADENCHLLCKCDPSLGIIVCKESRCKPSERCMVTNGVRGCKPISYSTCTGSGDPHYTTFDGKTYDFMGTCIYLLVGVSSADPSLTSFNVKVQNNNRGGDKSVSYTKVVTLEVYNTTFTLSINYPYQLLLNGNPISLPFYFQTNKVVAYISGTQGILKTNFEATISFDWDNYVAVTLPSTYINAVQGLCGNYNNNPNDDFTTKDGKSAPNADVFGNSWKVGEVPGCSSTCTGKCPLLCTEAQKQPYKSDKYCGLIINPNGPFGLCLSVVDPKPYFNNCVFDTCQFKGHPSSFCKAIGLYVAACQAAGVKIQEWRKPSFCSMTCPVNSHYELCGNACPVTCYGLSSPTGCDSPCKEACYCDNGFILSGNKCVPIRDCGCVYQGRYYQKNEVFYPQDQCKLRCQCGANGVVTCQSGDCRPEEECKLVNGAWGCQPKAYGNCTASGDPHYISFDGLRFDFQGTCTYIFAKVVVEDPQLVTFTVFVENESYGDGSVAVTKLVVVYVYGYAVSIMQNIRSKVKVDGELVNLPLTLEDDSIVVNQEGSNVVLQTDFGLKILYDAVYYVALEIPSSYRGKMGGLCGNFNGNDRDEFQLPSGQVVDNVNDFGASWKVDISKSKCSDGCVVCPVCTVAQVRRFVAQSSCGIITNPSGPFKACHAKINPNYFLSNCLYDSCVVDGKDDILCKSLQAYTAACQSLGIVIGLWRNSSFCPLPCPVNSHYELCTRTCDQTCFSLTEPTTCTDRCFEGCECDAGYVLNGDTCVTADKCGCVYRGRYLSEGESFVSVDCRKQCKCQFGGVTCTDFSCKVNERCGLVNGVRGCYKTEGSILQRLSLAVNESRDQF